MQNNSPKMALGHDAGTDLRICFVEFGKYMSQNSNFSTQASFSQGFSHATYELWQSLFAQETAREAVNYPLANEGVQLEPFYTYEKNQTPPPKYDFSPLHFPAVWRPVSTIDLAWDSAKIQRWAQLSIATGARELRCTAPDGLPLAKLEQALLELLPQLSPEISLQLWLALPQALHLSDALATKKQVVEGYQLNIIGKAPVLAGMVDSQMLHVGAFEAAGAAILKGLSVALCVDSLYEAGVGAALQLAIATAIAQTYARVQPDVKLQVQHALGREFILDIARLRAQRMLFHVHMPAVQFQVYGCSATRNKSIEDPNSNLFRLTTEGLAGILGGVDALMLSPHDSLAEASEDGLRLSLNMHQVLLHEAKLGQVQDPLRGTYVVEQLSSALVSQAEVWMGRIHAWGGIASVQAQEKLKEAMQPAGNEKI